MDKRNQLKHTFKLGKALLFLSIPVIAILLIFTGFFSFRRTTARLALDFYYPYLNAVHSLESKTASESLLLVSKEKLVNMVSLLMKQNAILNGNAEQVRNLTEENKQLRSLLKLGQYQNFQRIAAEIISRDPATWNEQFIISRGSKYGISPGDAVLSTTSSDGKTVSVLVGRVSDVSDNLAIVTTIRSEQCKISVTIPSIAATGTTMGEGGTKTYIKISMLPINSLYQLKERIETSGYSEHIPGGILVGYLMPFKDGRIARPERGGLYAEAQFLSAIQFDKLRFVTVLTKPKKE